MHRFTGFLVAALSLTLLIYSCTPTARIGTWQAEALPLIHIVAVAPVVVDSSTVAACPEAERVARHAISARISDAKSFKLVSTDMLMSSPDGRVASDVDSIVAAASQLHVEAVVFCKLTGIMDSSYKQVNDGSEISIGGSEGFTITPTYRAVYVGQKWMYPIVSIQVIGCATGEVLAETEFTGGYRFQAESLHTGADHTIDWSVKKAFQPVAKKWKL